MVKWVRGCGEIKASRQIHSRRGRENSSPPRSVAAPAEIGHCALRTSCIRQLELRRSWQPNRNFVFSLRPSRRDASLTIFGVVYGPTRPLPYGDYWGPSGNWRFCRERSAIGSKLHTFSRGRSARGLALGWVWGRVVAYAACAGAWGSPESSGSKTWGDHGQ